MEQATRLARVGQEYERKWREVRLKAKARYGELLPPKQPGGRPPKETLSAPKSSPPTAAEHVAKHQARKVAEVKQADPEGFTTYVENDPKPTEAGLLRTVAAAPKRPNLSQDQAVLDWVKARREDGWGRDKIVKASKAKTDDWPREDAALSNGGVTTILRLLEAGGEAPRPRPTLGQLRSAEKAMGTGYTGLLKFRRAVVELTALLQSMDVSQFDHDDEVAKDAIDSMWEELVDLTEWADLHIGWFQARAKDGVVKAKIAKLRNTTVANGATPAEADTAGRLADKLERKLALVA
jgi:hypothetical protein